MRLIRRVSADSTCHTEHECALLSCKRRVRQVVAVPSLLTQVADYIAKQNQVLDKLDIMLVEIGPNDVRPHVNFCCILVSDMPWSKHN